MKRVRFLLVLVTALLAVKAVEVKHRAKRGIGILEFGNMIKCETGRSSLNYLFYGCWCGAGGYGTPVDATDRCCKTHDMCYQSLVNAGTCNKGDWNGFKGWYTRVGCSGCSSGNTGCGRGLCYCDRTAARCFKGSRFNSKYQYWFNKGRC